MRFERRKGLGVAKKVGNANQQVAKQGINLGRCFLQVLDIRLQVANLVYCHAPANGAGLVLRKVVPGLGAQQRKNLVQRPFRLRHSQLAKGVRDVGQQLAARRSRLQQVQHALAQAHVVVGRNDVDAVGLHHHRVLHLQHLHAGVAANQLREEAFVVGRQVLHQHKGHAGVFVGGQARRNKDIARDQRSRKKLRCLCSMCF